MLTCTLLESSYTDDCDEYGYVTSYKHQKYQIRQSADTSYYDDAEARIQILCGCIQWKSIYLSYLSTVS